MVLLRDMIRSDIEDYVRWFTAETEWNDWDAPWEPIEEPTEEAQRKAWTEYYERVKDLPDDRIRWKFEIECDGRHIGWVSSYTDLGYLENEEKIPAVGIDVPEQDHRNRGAGTQALRLFIDYLKQQGYSSCYTQTWSGNERMMRVAEKLGFKEVRSEKGIREVNGKKYDAITWKLSF